MIVLSVDCMGGDHGPAVTLPACKRFLARHADAELLLVGRPEALKGLQGPRVHTVAAEQVVEMDDPLDVALRKKRRSSMRLAIEQVRDGNAAAAVSAGNTGALMAVARYLLKTMEGIERPAIATSIPNALGGATTVLDLGANVECSAEHLLQFALMGSALGAVLNEGKAPRVGLLNVGEEAIKGSAVIKQAAELMEAAADDGVLNFIGNVEGNDIFSGAADIVVCDGFVGNVTLKAIEGLATMIGAFLKEEFSRNPLRKLSGMMAYPVLKALKRRTDHRRYNGAALLGLRGLVFKSHGSADVTGFEFALERAYEAAHNHLLERVQEQIARTHAASPEPQAQAPAPPDTTQ